MYFSIITFSSLGYGDISPVGWSRLGASTEVILGLILMALSVGKIASERQYALVRLLYTSDHERRVSRLAEDLANLIATINASVQIFDHEAIEIESLKLYPFISGMSSYLVFQSSQGSLLDFGNAASLRKLYLTFMRLIYDLSPVALSPLTREITRKDINKTIFLVGHIAKDMITVHKSASLAGLLNQLITLVDRHLSGEIINKNSDAGYPSSRNAQITNSILIKVEDIVKRKGLYHHIHKDIGIELGIPNRLAERCINELKQRKHQNFVKDTKIGLMVIGGAWILLRAARIL